MENLLAHSQIYGNGKFLNIEKAPGRQIVSVLSTKEGGNEMKNMASRKRYNKETVEPYTARTDQRGKDAISAGATKQKDVISAGPT